ncbi:methyltransferase [Actinomycetospora sp. CA-101289]|uniref:methyltransferase n=1 Tax=Actinomycetospora sp. CA-101289 TaxID=3239893 RepID=UPI003D98A74B
MRDFAIMMGSAPVWRSWEHVLHSVRTGEPAFDHVYGVPVFEHYARDPEAAAVGVAGLHSRSVAENDAVVAAVDLGDARTLLDVGGGRGSLVRAFLAAHPHLRATLFDLAHVVRDGEEDERLSLVAGDFFAAVPGAHDVVVLKKVLHDWPDEQVTTILRGCAADLPGDGRVLVVENLVTPGNTPSFAKWLDLLMLVYAGGRERTEADFRALLAEAGLALRRVVPTATGISVLEATHA